MGEYDTWRNADKVKWDSRILPFQFGMRSICNSPETFPNYLFYPDMISEDKDIERIISFGQTILAYIFKTNQTLCRRGAFEADFMGYNVICLNASGVNSDTFYTVYDESKHDIMMPFFFDGKRWVFSLYTTKDNVDCSMIALQNGGGGHKKAAGFESDTLDILVKK